MNQFVDLLMFAYVVGFKAKISNAWRKKLSSCSSVLSAWPVYITNDCVVVHV